MAQIPGAYWNIILKLISSIVVLILTLVANRAVRSLLRVRVKERAHRHTLRMLIRNTMFVGASIVVLAMWLGFGSSFTVAMGVLGAGVAFASQEVIGSFAGYLNIVTGNLFHIGDRVRIGNVLGDVLDMSILRTTVMEIAEWVKADQYTGRIVSIANRVVFSDPVYNYTQHWPYIWDEITIPITYESDWQRAGELLLENGRNYSARVQAQAQEQLARMVERYSVQDVPVEPLLYIRMTDNWIEMTLRYVVDPRERRTVAAQLHLELLRSFQSDPKITVASATFEIVGFPPLRGM
jgi:hypothetical protein